MDGGAWWAAVHGVAKSWTRLNDFTFTFHFPALEKAMATHSSVLAWRIPGTGEPRGLPSMGSHRVGHDWSDLATAAESLCPSSPSSGKEFFQKKKNPPKIKPSSLMYLPWLSKMMSAISGEIDNYYISLVFKENSVFGLEREHCTG